VSRPATFRSGPKSDKAKEMTAPAAFNLALPTLSSVAARYYRNAVETG
jgi:hypothetical protein